MATVAILVAGAAKRWAESPGCRQLAAKFSAPRAVAGLVALHVGLRRSARCADDMVLAPILAAFGANFWGIDFGIAWLLSGFGRLAIHCAIDSSLSFLCISWGIGRHRRDVADGGMFAACRILAGLA